MKTYRFLFAIGLIPLLFLLALELSSIAKTKTSIKKDMQKESSLSPSTMQFHSDLKKLYDLVVTHNQQNNTQESEKLTKKLSAIISTATSFDPNFLFEPNLPCLSFVFSNIRDKPFQELAFALLKHPSLDPNKPAYQTGKSPLMCLIETTGYAQTNKELLKQLVEQLFQCPDFNINMKDKFEQSALQLSITENNFVIGYMILNNKRLVITKDDYTDAEQQLQVAQEKIKEHKNCPECELNNLWPEKQQFCELIIKKWHE